MLNNIKRFSYIAVTAIMVFSMTGCSEDKPASNSASERLATKKLSANEEHERKSAEATEAILNNTENPFSFDSKK